MSPVAVNIDAVKTVSYLIPKDEMTLTEMRTYRENALKKGIARAKVKLNLTEAELCVRPFENGQDVPAIVLDQWRTAALAAISTPAVPAAVSIFQAVGAFLLATNKVAVFYKVACEEAPLPVALLTFRKGGAAGVTIAEFDLEQLANATSAEGYFTDPVVYDPQDNIAVQVTPRIATGLFTRVQLGGWIIEPLTQRLV